MSKFLPKALLGIAFLSSALVIFIFLLVAYLCGELLLSGDIGKFFTTRWSATSQKFGIIVPLLGTFIISFFGLFLGFIFSFSLSSYIFLSTHKFMRNFLEKSVVMMASVPTVIYAFAALFVFVPFVSHFYPSSTLSILVASVTLSLLLIPTMTLIFLNIFRLNSAKFQSICLNLGLSKDEFFFKFLVANSFGSMLTGIILAMSRALGDTMIALMLAGNALFLPSSPLDSTRTLTSHIALIFASDYGSLAFKGVFVCSFLLLSSNLLLILILNFIKSRANESS